MNERRNNQAMQIDQNWTQFELFYEAVRIVWQHRDDKDPGILNACGVTVQWNQDGVRIIIPDALNATTPQPP